MKKKGEIRLGIVVYTYHPRFRRRRNESLKTTWAIEQVLEQSGLHSKTVKKQKKKSMHYKMEDF